MQEVDCEVYAHMCSLTPSPLEFAFPWLWTAFASHLAPSETLLLWDRVIGFDSLLPLPVLAVAVLTFRCANSWLSSRTVTEYACIQPETLTKMQQHT